MFEQDLIIHMIIRNKEISETFITKVTHPKTWTLLQEKHFITNDKYKISIFS